MKRLVLYIGIGLVVFASGVVTANVWKSRSTPSSVATVQRPEEERPLTKHIVSRSLQSHSFTTEKLQRNSNDEVVWRWLKASIANFPQNWVKLDISNDETYLVILYPLKVLEASELDSYNKELQEKGLRL